MGQFLGFSDEHLSLVANVRNLRIGYIISQFHAVFDYLFQNVINSGENNIVVDVICYNCVKANGTSMKRMNSLWMGD